MDNSPVTLLILVALFAVIFAVGIPQELRSLRTRPGWDAWRRTARTLSLHDRRRLYLATLLGRQLHDPRLARLAVQRGEAALAAGQGTEQLVSDGPTWVTRTGSPPAPQYRHPRSFFLGLGAGMTGMLLSAAIRAFEARTWLDWATVALLLFLTASLAFSLFSWSLLGWNEHHTRRSIELNRRHAPDQHAADPQ